MSGHCEPGRRLGYVFWGHAKGPEAEAVLARRFKEGAPKAALWRREDANITVIVPDEVTGLQVVEVARDLKLKSQKVDFVSVDASCRLDWMNKGVDVAALQSKPKDAPDAGPPTEASATPAGDTKASGRPEPSAEAKACDAAIGASAGDYAKASPHQTSVASTKMLLRTFAKVCAPSFPELAKAADRAARVGRKERSRLLGEAARGYCAELADAKLADAKSAEEIARACPPVDGDVTLAVWRSLDPGTYLFAQHLKKLGVTSTLVDEIILQASLHPELDK